MLAIAHSGFTTGVTPSVCMVEAHRSAQGLPSFTVVGRRHDPRWLSAIDTLRGGRLGGRVTVNITHNPPSTMEGLGLAVVMATLATIPNEPIDEFGWVGEVQADGTITASVGMIPVVKAMKDAGLITVGPEGSRGDYIVGSISEAASLTAHLDHGTPTMQRVALIAAAGGHPVLVPKWSPVDRIAQRILPPPDRDEVADIYSAAGIHTGVPAGPPLRTVTASSTLVSTLGGWGGSIRPGDVSLAHGGVLSLSDVEGFQVSTLDGIRRAGSDGRLTVARGNRSATLPADFLLVGTISPPTSTEGAKRRTARIGSTFSLSFGHDTKGITPCELTLGRMAEVVRRVRGVMGVIQRMPAEQVNAYRFSTGADQIITQAVSMGRISASQELSLRRVALTISRIDEDTGGDGKPIVHISSAMEALVLTPWARNDDQLTNDDDKEGDSDE